MPLAPPTAAELLAEADTWSVSQRRHALPALALEWQDHPAFPGLLAALAQTGGFGARLSLALAETVGHLGHLEALLEHPSTAAAAFKAATRHPALESAVAASLPEQPKAVRLAAFTALRKHRNETLADRLLTVIADRYGPGEAATLLPACSHACVAARLPEYAGVVSAWGSLAEHHGGVFTAYATAALAERRPEQWHDWWATHRNGLGAAIEQAPLAWLDLLERHPAPGTADQVVLRRLPILLTADRERTWNYLLDPQREALLQHVMRMNAHLRRIAAEPAERIATFMRHGGEIAGVLTYVAPSRRDAVIAAIREAGVHVDDEAVLALLPQRTRVATARRLLGDRRIAGHAAHRDAVRAHLPFHEVKDDFAAAAKRSDVQERARAYRHLVGAAARAHDPEAVTELLHLLQRTANDQGVVHDAVLRELQAVRSWDWTAAHLDDLTALTESWLASPARSASTVSQLLAFAVRTLLAGLSTHRPHLTAFGEHRIQRLLTEGNGWELRTALHRLPRHIMVDLARRAEPALAAKAEVDDFAAVFTLAAALDGRLDANPGIESLLRLALHSKAASQVTQAIDLLAAVKRGRHDRIGELARTFPTRRQLLRPIARHRCDLLPRRLEPIRYGDPAGLVHLFTATEPHLIDDWPPAVRNAYTATLRAIATDDRWKERHRADAAKALLRTPELPLDAVTPLLDGDDPHVKAAALAALHHLTPAEAVWELLPAHLDSPNAAVAAAAMERLARASRPELIAAQAARLLDSPKITVRKQVVRLLSRYRVAGAAAILAGLWAEPDLHPSVREAVAAVAADRLREPWAQTLIDTVDQYSADVQAAALGLRPEQVPATFRDRYVALLTAAASADDERLQTTGSQGLARWARYETRAADALIDLAGDLDGNDVWAAAMNALCAIAIAGGDAEPLLRTVDRLNGESDRPDAGEDRDLPVRQRFERLIAALTPQYGPPATQPVIDAVAARLPTDLGTRLLAGRLDWDAGSEDLRRLTARIADPIEAKLIGEQLDERMDHRAFNFTLDVVTALAEDHDPHAAIIAACIIENAAEDWDDPWRDLLRGLRAHPSSMVRVLANRVFTSEEYQGGGWY